MVQEEAETKIPSGADVAMESTAAATAAASPTAKAVPTDEPSAAQPGSSSSVSDGEGKDAVIKKALNALVQGKRHYLMKDATLACAALGDACRILSEVYGPLSTASEHAEAHFFYGKALLDQARLDLAVFDAPPAGGEVQSGDEDTEESEDEDGEEEDEKEKGEKKDESDDASADADKMEVPDENENDADAKADEEDKMDAEVTLNEEDINVPSPVTNGHGPSSSASSSTLLPVDDEKPSTSKGVAETEESPEEELSNLELAWEVLEIAKLGYMKQIESLKKTLESETLEEREKVEQSLKDLKSKLAETHSLLGEVGTESEIYPQAIGDFKTALAMYTEFEAPDSRDIAQVHFHMGIAHSLAKNYQESVDSLRESVKIIRGRIENLKKQVEENKAKADGQNGEGPDALEKEILDLSDLVPELEEKISDTLEQEKDAEKAAEEEKIEEEMIKRNSPVKNPNPPIANDISHLVKKRKKVEPEEPSSGAGTGTAEAAVEPPSKKACTNLTFDTAVSSNGHSSKEVAAPEAVAAEPPK